MYIINCMISGSTSRADKASGCVDDSSCSSKKRATSSYNANPYPSKKLRDGQGGFDLNVPADPFDNLK